MDDLRMTLESLWGHFGIAFGLLRRLSGHFGITFGIWWWLRGSFGVSRWSLFAVEGSFWGGLSGTLGALAAYGVDFEAIVGSVWGQFGYLWVTLGHLMVTLQSLWIHLGYMKVLSQKTFIFPTYLNDFIKLFGGLWVDLRLLWGRFWRMKVTLEPL